MPKAIKLAWPDDRLVGECLKGHKEAWEALIDKYKNLIYSVPIKQGFSPGDASDIFQAVCLELLEQLPNLRKPQALAAWIIQTTSHRCYHLRRQNLRMASGQLGDVPDASASNAVQEDLLYQLEREQILREALSRVAPRCHDLLRMLFFESEPRPYDEIAAALGLATGSIGFIRMRCLERLRRELEKTGFR